MGELSWSEVSQNDLIVIGDYIARDSPDAAIHFIERIIQAVEVLLDQPELGRIVPEFNRSDLRELIFQKYRIVYRLDEHARIMIVTVAHAAMDLNRKNRKEQWEL